ncbi:hypothetical protein QMK19_39690 [Streptomyces sp. H10-C2]|nr:hypothetical protein [Streptomyces sp. H10-C2]
MDDDSELIRLVREWHCLVPRMGAGAAFNALVTALADESASAATIVGLKAQFDLIEEQRDHARDDRSP